MDPLVRTLQFSLIYSTNSECVWFATTMHTGIEPVAHFPPGSHPADNPALRPLPVLADGSAPGAFAPAIHRNLA
ncbi:hypothetical protein G6F23_014430 [Rhizopus arrhizus]|nr:hypothetical protein G6F23_014430 [Rhizopus arrhizus]